MSVYVILIPLSWNILSDLHLSFMFFVRIITYVMLCGYSPFRSEEPADLIRETTEAKITFHERYWKNVSKTGMITRAYFFRFHDTNLYPFYES